MMSPFHVCLIVFYKLSLFRVLNSYNILKTILNFVLAGKNYLTSVIRNISPVPRSGGPHWVTAYHMTVKENV